MSSRNQLVVVLIEIFLGEPSPCSPCLRGDKGAENHFTAEARRTQTAVKNLTRTLPTSSKFEGFSDRPNNLRRIGADLIIRSHIMDLSTRVVGFYTSKAC
jgi:hypothetical protein